MLYLTLILYIVLNSCQIPCFCVQTSAKKLILILILGVWIGIIKKRDHINVQIEKCDLA